MGHVLLLARYTAVDITKFIAWLLRESKSDDSS